MEEMEHFFMGESFSFCFPIRSKYLYKAFFICLFLNTITTSFPWLGFLFRVNISDFTFSLKYIIYLYPRYPQRENVTYTGRNLLR